MLHIQPNQGGFTMTIQTLYTANGNLIRRRTPDGVVPVIRVCRDEYEVDQQELLIWALLNWRIVTFAQIGPLYEKANRQNPLRTSRSWQDCTHRLLTRGLLISGMGNTEYDALYDLLARRFVRPVSGGLLSKVLAFLRVTLFDGISLRTALTLFRIDRRSASERKVMRLANQVPLSCAEIIQCLNLDVRTIPSEDAVMDALYTESDLTCDNFPQKVYGSQHSREVIEAVAGLYLRKQILLDTY